MRRRLIGLGLVATIGTLSYGAYCSLAPRTITPAASEAVAAERVRRPTASRVRITATATARKPTPEMLASHVHTAAARHGVPPTLLAAVIAAESEFNPRAVSHRGAVGLMQLMPMTAVLLGVRNAFDPYENVHAGARYLRELLGQFSNDVPLALAAYNAGPQAVIRHGGVPPYPETRKFIARVMHRMREPKSGGVVMAAVAATASARPEPSRVRLDTSPAEPPSYELGRGDAVRVSLDIADVAMAASSRPVAVDAALTPPAVNVELSRTVAVSTEAP
jgi:hypothetical protein